MKMALTSGEVIEFAVGAALVGYDVAAVTITAQDLASAGSVEELLRYLDHNCLIRLSHAAKIIKHQ
jgi:hypothetical protein